MKHLVTPVLVVAFVASLILMAFGIAAAIDASFGRTQAPSPAATPVRKPDVLHSTTKDGKTGQQGSTTGSSGDLWDEMSKELEKKAAAATTSNTRPWLQTALCGALSWILATVLRAPLEAYSKKLFVTLLGNDQIFRQALGFRPLPASPAEIPANPATAKT